MTKNQVLNNYIEHITSTADRKDFAGCYYHRELFFYHSEHSTIIYASFRELLSTVFPYTIIQKEEIIHRVVKTFSKINNKKNDQGTMFK